MESLIDELYSRIHKNDDDYILIQTDLNISFQGIRKAPKAFDAVFVDKALYLGPYKVGGYQPEWYPEIPALYMIRKNGRMVIGLDLTAKGVWISISNGVLFHSVEAAMNFVLEYYGDKEIADQYSITVEEPVSI